MSLREQAKAASAAAQTPVRQSEPEPPPAEPVYSPPIGALPAPPAEVHQPDAPGALRLTRTQYEALLRAIHPNRVRQLRGNSHLEAWDVRRTLTRIFGFGGWDLETIELVCVREITNPPGTITYANGGSNAKDAHTVVYRAQVRLTIKNPDGTVGAVYEDGASGDSINQPALGDAHDQAMKTALSQAVKRCAVNLGDQFGMSLYSKGSMSAVVIRTAVGPGVGTNGQAGAAPSAATAMVDSEPVYGEESASPEPSNGHPDPAGQDMQVPDLPSAQQLANEALEPRTTRARLSTIYATINPRNKDATRPELATVEVVNAVGDDEKLGMLIYNQIQARRNEGEERE